MLLTIGLAALLLGTADRARALTFARITQRAVAPLVPLEPADSRNPTAPLPVAYPAPGSVPIGVSICGPLFTAAQRPTCKASGTIIHGERGGLASYGLVIALPSTRRFPNLTRDITMSQRVAGGLYMVLAHAKFDGQLVGTQVIPLSQLQTHLRLQLLGSTIYRIEVDQKTGALDFRHDLVGVATFTYTR